jgi:hypothetical protein
MQSRSVTPPPLDASAPRSPLASVHNSPSRRIAGVRHKEVTAPARGVPPAVGAGALARRHKRPTHLLPCPRVLPSIRMCLLLSPPPPRRSLHLRLLPGTRALSPRPLQHAACAILLMRLRTTSSWINSLPATSGTLCVLSTVTKSPRSARLNRSNRCALARRNRSLVAASASQSFASKKAGYN